jgi:hypothetical protein
MTVQLKIGYWGRLKRNYVLVLDETHCYIHLEKVSYKVEEKDGVLKKFLFGKQLILFSLNGERHLFFKGNSYPLNSEKLQLICRSNFLFNTLMIMIDGKILCRFYDATLMSNFDKRDPLYDDFDREMDDFIYYLITLWNEYKTKEPIKTG